MKKILVIASDKTYRLTILDLLQANGFNTLGVDNAAAGVKLARKVIPDIIISDVVTPEVDCFQVLKELREFQITASIPIIFLAATVDELNLTEATLNQAASILLQAFQNDELLEIINKMLAVREAATQKNYLQVKYAEEKLQYLKSFDPITRLPNKRALLERLELELAEAVKQDQVISLVSLCIDQYEKIKEGKGHAYSNSLMLSVADLIRTSLDPDDVAARINVNQFALLLTTVKSSLTDSAFQAARIAQNLLNKLSEPLRLADEAEFTAFTASIGIALYPCDSGNNIESFINSANTAMFQAKKEGGNEYIFYSSEISFHSFEQLSLEIELTQALQNKEMELYYQPQFDLQRGIISGVEALLRWNHPKLGLLMPGEFIALAEASGQIVQIGEWVIKTACDQALAWQKIGPGPVRMAVNLSARQFNEQHLDRMVVRILKQTGLNPNLLEMELTESSIMQNIESGIQTLYDLKSLGVRISIDDFGTGYSSLSHLSRFPFDKLKIDQRFVHNIAGDEQNTVILNAIIQLAHNLGQRVIAEGVETEAEARHLSQHNCDEIQGYYLSRPLPAAEFEKLLAQHKPFKI